MGAARGGRKAGSEGEPEVGWGVGPDARTGDQPRGTHVVGNLVREIGIW